MPISKAAEYNHPSQEDILHTQGALQVCRKKIEIEIKKPAPPQKIHHTEKYLSGVYIL